ncbi:MAG TPA: hypothetical protein VNW06_03175 [Cytophagaceae bacterium]|jgi:hypothetical protein|nr:hypothetical protein [Cytophagaceae bacterium]
MDTTTTDCLLCYFFSFLLGFFYSFTELLKQFRDGSTIFRITAGWAYMLLNGFISIVAYYIVDILHLKVGEKEISETAKILLSGLSAMSILRSSFFSVKVGNSQIKQEVTPVIQVILSWVHNRFDQKRAGLMIGDVKKIMENVDFQKAELILPDLCIELMKTMSEADQKKLGAKVQKIKSSLKLVDAGIDVNFVKALNLGLIVAEHAGIVILRDAVKQLGKNIEKTS